MRKISLLVCLSFFLSGMVFHSAVLAATAQVVLTEIQSQYEKTNDFEANFAQEYIGKVMRQSQKGEGKVDIKKKGMMRWDYKTPNQKIISDGQTLWFYQPEDIGISRNSYIRGYILDFIEMFAPHLDHASIQAKLESSKYEHSEIANSFPLKANIPSYVEVKK